MKAYPYGATSLFFKSNADISTYSIPAKPINWGMDVAWNDGGNVVRGANHIGSILNIGRVSFQPSDLVDSNGNLSTEQQKTLQDRLNNIAKSGVKDIVLNCDHEVLCNKEAYPNCDQNYANYHGKPQEWYRVIKASIKYCKAKGFNVITVSPFNEPDYTDWKEGSKDDFRNICKLISEDPELAGIRISAGNTLNCDRAMEWYSYMKPYVTEGNTHQLAGEFNTYADFWKTVVADGNHATADELHNTMEAFVGVHYGMNSGIWWGFDGAARGEYCKATATGKEIGYAESRSTWTAATVYKRADGRIDAFLGGSERQASDCNYELISTDRPVYFDGYGPYYNYFMQVPGGTGYSKDQPNADRIIQVKYGADVPCEPIVDGDYVIMSMSTSTVLGYTGGSCVSGGALGLAGYTMTSTNSHQKWNIKPVSPRQGGDFSYFTITSTEAPNLYVDLMNWSTSVGGTLIGYNGGGSGCEQWMFEYAGNNTWYIRSRYSGLYLEAKSSTVSQNFFAGTDAQRWRLMPLNTRREKTAPQAPAGLTATPQSGSVLLSWNANTESDLLGYQVLRAKEGTDDWDVIAPKITGTKFIDNMLSCACTYSYKVKALDVARNVSAASDAVSARASADKALVLHYTFEDNLQDETANALTAQAGGDISYSASMGVKQGSKSLQLSSSKNNYLLLPTTVAGCEQMSVAFWVYNPITSSGKSWTRIFDFGNGEDQYMFLTPSNGSEMRFVMKNGGEEQIVSTDKLESGLHHVAVTVANDAVTLYVDGEKKAASTSFTIRPSDLHAVRNYIGRSQFAADPLFNGYLDDFRIYNYPITDEDVKLLYDGKEPTAIKTMEQQMEDNGTCYDLSGRKITAPAKGIFIKNGQKLTVK
ncbi:MAG: RICIN domain-containing protein [Bacteroidaceae bacterium]|nr:RICIN domain-containing protein [Bacteroidaceae bacterium]